MTVEAALMKLAYVLSKDDWDHEKKKEVGYWWRVWGLDVSGNCNIYTHTILFTNGNYPEISTTSEAISL